ncbi:MAG: hypothetical protein ACOC38_11555 [Promethearchaeia archaeon]
MVDSGCWNGSDVSFTVNVSQVGDYTVKLVLSDVFGNRAEDIATVEVRSSTDETSTGFPSYLLVGFSVFGIALVVIAWLLYGWVCKSS